MKKKHAHRARAFTLIELLVVIAIIMVVAAIAFPVFAGTIRRAKATTCISNLRQVYLATELYYQDFGDWTHPFPTMDVLRAYAQDVRVFSCPEDHYVREQTGLGYPVNIQENWMDPDQTYVPYRISYAYVGVPDITQTDAFWQDIREKANVGLFICQWHGEPADDRLASYPFFNPSMDGPIHRIAFDGHFVKAHRQDPPSPFSVDDLFFRPWRRLPGGGLGE